MSKKITTVLGDIAPEELGFASLHDHTVASLTTAASYLRSIFFDVDPAQLTFTPENYAYLKTGTFLLSDGLQLIDSVDELADEYAWFKKLGGNAVVDPLPCNVRIPGYAEKVMELSRRTGLHFVTATGFYHDSAIPAELKEHDVDFYYSIMKKEITDGIEGTSVRPGCLKGAFNTCSQTERNIVEACIRLTAETGLSTHVHTEPTVDGEELVAILDELCEKYGVAHERVHVCHLDNRIVAGTMVMDFLEDFDTQRTLDLEVHKALLSRGYTIGLDTWGMPIQNENMFMPDDFDRVKALVMLLDLGYEDQITLGNDFSSKIEWRKYGGYGCTRFADFGLRLLELMGREEQAHKLVYENPARILAY